MIKLNDNKTKSNLLKLINKEISFIDTSLAYQRSLNKEVLLCMNLITQNSEVIETAMEFSKNYEALNNVMSLLKKSTFNIDTLEALLSQLYEIKNNENNTTITNKISKFNENYLDVIDEITTNTMKIECFLKADFQEVENQNKAIAESAKKVKVRTKEVNLLPNTLIISEIENRVILPYTLSDIKNILKASPAKYTSAQDVINQLYTIPLKYYKNSAISRFREAYKLVRERDKGTLLQAVDLATELFFNYNLHPAIITACKNSNELDVYLSCLEYNELEDFTSFKIVFQGLPAVSKKAFKKGHNFMNKLSHIDSNATALTNQNSNTNSQNVLDTNDATRLDNLECCVLDTKGITVIKVPYVDEDMTILHKYVPEMHIFGVKVIKKQVEYVNFSQENTIKTTTNSNKLLKIEQKTQKNDEKQSKITNNSNKLLKKGVICDE